MNIARIYLGVLLALMAVGQLASLRSFVDAIEDYRVAGPFAAILAAALIALELAAAVGLLLAIAARARRAAAWLALAVAVAWSLLALQGLARGLELDNCGCFGRFLSQPLTLWVIPQDAIFVALAIVVVRRRPQQHRAAAGAV
ncbi:MAG: MauE/DoxX family redox-associated membrane protein [Solirubrobacteraceae bacterium]